MDFWSRNMGIATELVGKIRRTMKERGLTYKDLAALLEVSESSLKRSFSKTLFSIERIDQICAALNLTLEELGKPDLSGFRVEFLSDEQEELLAIEEKLFVVFYLIASGFSFDSISAHFDFEKRELERILLRLDKLNLIKLYSGNAVVACVKQGVWWKLDGPLSKKYGELIRSDFFKSKFEGASEHAWLTAGNLSPESISTLRKKQDQVVSTFQELIELDAHLPTKRKINLTFISGLRPWTLPPIRRYLKRNDRGKK
jgi:transcriptional regulator with XRE-family HTH domain